MSGFPDDFILHLRANVAAALKEDIRSLSPALSPSRERGIESRYAALADNDLTAQLIPANTLAQATVITRQNAVLCGTDWFDECFRTLDADCTITWLVSDGDLIKAGRTLCEISGQARGLLTAERSALNFLQLLSATATLTRQYVDAVQSTAAKIMDTRKTIPGLRFAQKYAVRTGGGHNQRMGLFDGILIKENHILAAGGIGPVLQQALRTAPAGTPVQIEVENIEQLRVALDAGAKLVLLDNFELAQMRAAVELTAGRAELEASGGITLQTVHAIAETGVNRISIGGLTKDVQAIDLSMRFDL